MFNVGIIGFGKLGSSLARAFSKMNCLSFVVDNNLDVLKYKSEFPKVKFYNSISDIEHPTDYIFLTVPDSLIQSTAGELTAKFSRDLSGKNVIHCSGALPLEILDSCKEVEANTGSIHPYQTFFYYNDDLFKCAWTVHSDEIEDELFNLVKLLGGKAFKSPEDEKQKALYHASAVVASNFMSVLLSLSKDIINKTDMKAEELLPPIIKQTIKNKIRTLEENSELPLTGPFARADKVVIEQHIQALSDDNSMQREYIYLSLFAIERLKSLDKIDDEQYQELETMLKSNL